MSLIFRIFVYVQLKFLSLLAETFDIARLQGWCDMGKDTRPGYITLKSGLQIFGHQVAFYTNLKDVYKE